MEARPSGGYSARVEPLDTIVTDAGWRAVEAAFGVLGRAVLLLDEGFHVLRATSELDRMVCDGAARNVIGRPVRDLLGESLFGPAADMRRGLETGARQEGRRGFLSCRDGGARLVSVSATVLPNAAVGSYLVVIRPAETDALLLQHASPLIAASASMTAIVGLIERLHRSEASLLITGESGVGKEAVARAFHAHSPRREGPFIAVNCAAIPADLLESELFGHVRGAFTGASSDRVGRFQMARGGTLFLDEIGDMPGHLQVRLLRVLQEGTYSHLGESRLVPLDARVMSATHVDLERAIERGDFREDLYYRLRVVPVGIPPLRDRPEDVEPMVRFFLSRIGAREGRALLLSPDTLAAMRRFEWPGNVRQLQNALEYAVAMCQGQTLRPDHLPPELQFGTGPQGSATRGAAGSSRSAPADRGGDDSERIQRALEATRWNRGAAAERLGMSRTTLWRRMRELGLG